MSKSPTTDPLNAGRTAVQTVAALKQDLEHAIKSVVALSDELEKISHTLEGKDHLAGAAPITEAVQVGKELSAGKAPVLKSLEPVFAKHERDVAPEDIKTRDIGGQKDVEVHRKRWEVDKEKKGFVSDKSTQETQYLNEEQRKKYEVGARENPDGTTALNIQQGHDVTDKVLAPQSPKEQGTSVKLEQTSFVVDKDGKKIYAGNVEASTKKRGTDEAGDLHHSSFLAGEDVSGAGELYTDKDGVLKKMSNQSGHYRPGEEQTQQSIDALRNMGVNMDNVRLKQLSEDGTHEGMVTEFEQGGAKTFAQRHDVVNEMRGGKASLGAVKFKHQQAVANAQLEIDEKRRKLKEDLGKTQEEGKRGDLQKQLDGLDDELKAKLENLDKGFKKELLELKKRQDIAAANDKANKQLKTAEKAEVEKQRAREVLDIERQRDFELKVGARGLIAKEHEAKIKELEKESYNKSPEKELEDVKKWAAAEEKKAYSTPGYELEIDGKKFKGGPLVWELKGKVSEAEKKVQNFPKEEREKLDRELAEAKAKAEMERDGKLEELRKTLGRPEEEIRKEAEEKIKAVNLRAKEDTEKLTLPKEEEEKIIRERDEELEKINSPQTT
jgi:hypothetical protein